MVPAPSFIWFADVDITAAEFSKHTRQLAELFQAKFPLSPGFIITQEAYFAFLKENKLDHKVSQLLSTIAIDRPDSLMQGEQHIQKLFQEAKLSEEFTDELLAFYDELGGDVVIELHATGPQPVKHTTAKAKTEKAFLEKIKHAWATMFTAQALWQRHHHALDHMTTGATIIVKIRLPQHKSGKATTVQMQTHAKDVITILTGEHDRYHLSKKNFTILERDLKLKSASKLTHDELLEIATLAKELEQHLYFPQEVTWAYADDLLYIVETKQISTLNEEKIETKRRLPIARGLRITPTIGTGLTKVIKGPSDFQGITEEHIVILPNIETKHFQILKKTKGIITESGHPHTEIATLLRKHGIPTIFSVKNATKQFKNGHLITIHGDKGEIYSGGF